MVTEHRERTIVLVRHAKAEPDAGSDHVRALTARGRGDAGAAAAAVGAALSTGDEAAGERSLALVSSAARAVESWQRLAGSLVSPPGIEQTVTDELYEAGVDDVVGLLRRLDEDVAAVVVVGHNPTTEATLEALAGSADRHVRARLDERGFPTAAVGTLSYAGAWTDLGPGACRLVGFEVGRAG